MSSPFARPSLPDKLPDLNLEADDLNMDHTLRRRFNYPPRGFKLKVEHDGDLALEPSRSMLRRPAPPPAHQAIPLRLSYGKYGDGFTRESLLDRWMRMLFSVPEPR